MSHTLKLLAGSVKFNSGQQIDEILECLRRTRRFLWYCKKFGSFVQKIFIQIKDKKVKWRRNEIFFSSFSWHFHPSANDQRNVDGTIYFKWKQKSSLSSFSFSLNKSVRVRVRVCVSEREFVFACTCVYEK